MVKFAIKLFVITLVLLILFSCTAGRAHTTTPLPRTTKDLLAGTTAYSSWISRSHTLKVIPGNLVFHPEIPGLKGHLTLHVYGDLYLGYCYLYPDLRIMCDLMFVREWVQGESLILRGQFRSE